MAKGIYVGVSGIARKVNKEYVGVGGVARKVTKGYVGVGGIARECYSSGVTWKKYTCSSMSGTYIKNNPYIVQQTRSFAFESGTGTGIQNVYTNYSFNPSFGFQGLGYTQRHIPNNPTVADIADALVGYYYVATTTNYDTWADKVQNVIKISSMNTSTGFGYVVLEVISNTATFYPEAAVKGTLISTIEVPVGTLPETGILRLGSAEGDFCVLEISGNLYYYEKA